MDFWAENGGGHFKKDEKTKKNDKKTLKGGKKERKEEKLKKKMQKDVLWAMCFQNLALAIKFKVSF